MNSISLVVTPHSPLSPAQCCWAMSLSALSRSPSQQPYLTADSWQLQLGACYIQIAQLDPEAGQVACTGSNNRSAPAVGNFDTAKCRGCSDGLSAVVWPFEAHGIPWFNMCMPPKQLPVCSNCNLGIQHISPQP